MKSQSEFFITGLKLYPVKMCYIYYLQPNTEMMD